MIKKIGLFKSFVPRSDVYPQNRHDKINKDKNFTDYEESDRDALTVATYLNSKHGDKSDLDPYIDLRVEQNPYDYAVTNYALFLNQFKLDYDWSYIHSIKPVVHDWDKELDECTNTAYDGN